MALGVFFGSEKAKRGLATMDVPRLFRGEQLKRRPSTFLALRIPPMAECVSAVDVFIGRREFMKFHPQHETFSLRSAVSRCPSTSMLLLFGSFQMEKLMVVFILGTHTHGRTLCDSFSFNSKVESLEESKNH